jgi:RNA 3'-terminal phosphate cyclase (ATP)
MGAGVQGILHRHGFFPAGGGKIEVTINPPKTWLPFARLEKGPLHEKKIRILGAHLPPQVLANEASRLTEKLGWDEKALVTERVTESLGPGNAIIVHLQHGEHGTVFSAFGQKGMPVPRVVDPLVKEVQTFLAAPAPVCVHLADQLLVPLVLGAGGAFVTVGQSDHFKTNAEVISHFVDADVRTHRRGRGDVLVEVVP